MDKAIESTGNEIKEIPFDFTRHIVIPNRVAKILSNEVWTETTLINNYFNIEERLNKNTEMKDAINKLLGKLYSEFGKENVWITICDNKDYNAIVAKIDSNDTGEGGGGGGGEVRGEFHIYFTSFGGLERTIYLFKTHIEIMLSGWNSIDYKDFCKEIHSFAKESGIGKFKGYRCDHPVFYVISKTVNIRESDYELMFNTIRTLADRYELGEWNAEKIRMLVAPKYLS